ncbi:SH3 domain-containing protein [soil metagenome]
MSGLIRLPGILACLSLAVLTQVAQAKEMVSVARPTINMRSGAGPKQAVRWALSKGYPLEVTRRQGNWLKVRDFENDVGWVYRPSVNKTPHVIVKAGVANVRSVPSTRGRIVGKADYGEVMKSVEQRSQWVKVQRKSGVKGWISRSLLWGW